MTSDMLCLIWALSHIHTWKHSEFQQFHQATLHTANLINTPTKTVGDLTQTQNTSVARCQPMKSLELGMLLYSNNRYRTMRINLCNSKNKVPQVLYLQIYSTIPLDMRKYVMWSEKTRHKSQKVKLQNKGN